MRDHRNEVLRTILGGLGAPAALALVGWPAGGLPAALVALAGVVAGVSLAFIIERVLDRRTDIGELRTRVRELEAAAESYRQERILHEHRIAVALMESAINATHLEVYADAYREGLNGGQVPPVAAVMARLEMSQRARNLDKPLEPPKLT